ncbi:MAG: S-methyl-5-thioribose-1-phosphate isomerase [Eggerthella lenta]
MTANLRLDRLPRTVELARAADGAATLAYVDQRLLPGKLAIERTADWGAVVDAIKTLAVRGAPAIGVAGAAAVALWAREAAGGDTGAGEVSAYRAALERTAEEIACARPTAVNLRWAVERVLGRARVALDGGAAPAAVADALFAEAKRMEAEDEAANRAIGAHGAALLRQGSRVLTHCNAGSLATAFYGTALGVVYAAAEQGKIERVYADETRPVGQGARLTSWELARAGVPCTLVCDNMAASLMAKGEVDAVIVGADRIAANGDAANKIGTYGVAVLARHHGIPFYVAAPPPPSTRNRVDGSGILIEGAMPPRPCPSRSRASRCGTRPSTTSAGLITRIVTERGAFEPDKLVY